MLTGVIPASDGEAYVDGRSITSDLKGIHSHKLGFCPQYDILFD